jgi:hypothetical protein
MMHYLASRLLAQRGPMHGIIAAALLLAALSPATSHADSAVISSTEMGANGQAGESPVTVFPTGVAVVYFDFTVVTPSSSDTAEVDVYAGGTGGSPVATSGQPLVDTGFYPVPLLPPGNATSWPDGGYCTVLKIDGVPTSLGGALPIPWIVGNATLPSCALSAGNQPTAIPTGTLGLTTPTPAVTGTITLLSTVTPVPTITQGVVTPASTATQTIALTPTPSPAAASPTPSPTRSATATPLAEQPHLAHFVLTLAGQLYVKRSGLLRVTVNGTKGKPVKGAEVRFDGHRAGIGKQYHAHTGGHGVVTFRGLRPTRSGTVYISARKSGWWDETVGLEVQSAAG